MRKSEEYASKISTWLAFRWALWARPSSLITVSDRGTSPLCGSNLISGWFRGCWVSVLENGVLEESTSAVCRTRIGISASPPKAKWYLRGTGASVPKVSLSISAKVFRNHVELRFRTERWSWNPRPWSPSFVAMQTSPLLNQGKLSPGEAGLIVSDMVSLGRLAWCWKLSAGRLN